MKTIQLLGSRSKSDFTLYLGYTIASMKKRVLIVDATQREEYLYSYVRFQDDEWLYDLQNVEILCGGITTWLDVEEKLRLCNETTTNFDCIIVDATDGVTLDSNWPKFNEVLYVSDNDRANIMRDVQILHTYVDKFDVNEIRRVHFESAFSIPDGYINLLIHDRIRFSGLSESFEYDELEEKLRLIMQHDHVIPYNRLNKHYRKALQQLVSEWFLVDRSEVEESAKSKLLGVFFKRFKPQSHLQPNKKMELPGPINNKETNITNILETDNSSNNSEKSKMIGG